MIYRLKDWSDFIDRPTTNMSLTVLPSRPTAGEQWWSSGLQQTYSFEILYLSQTFENIRFYYTF